jgi:hypothetical protein
MGVYFLGAYLIDPLYGLPKKLELEEVSGQIEWVNEHEYGVKFKFYDHVTIFNYMSKVNAVGLVESSLNNAGNEEVKVLIKRDDIDTNLTTGQKFNAVYQIEISDQSVRSYDEIKEAWASDTKIGLYMGPFFLFCAFYIYRRAKKGDYGPSEIHY